jgi:CheY-like chemotaxis protein
LPRAEPRRGRAVVGFSPVSENPTHPVRTLLVVEDNDLFRGMVRSLLTMRGYNIIPARNGPEGLAIAAAQSIDGALTDIEMPEMDGFEFCRQLREQQQAAGRDVPVWIMSGVFRPALEKKAAAAGAILVLRKPFPIDQVCAHLEAEFERRDRGA